MDTNNHELEIAKNFILDYFCREFGEQDQEETLFNDLSKIGLAYTTDESEEHFIQVDVDLINFRILTYIDNKLIKTEQYKSLHDMNDGVLDGLDFDELTIPIYEIDEEE